MASSEHSATLPLEILENIATKSPSAWNAMTAIPEFGRYTLTRGGVTSGLKAFFCCIEFGDPWTPREDKHKGVSYLSISYRGLLHSFANNPSREKKIDGVVVHKEWHCKGELHRKNGPALIYPEGGLTTMEWYNYGERHNDNDLPAVIKMKDGIPVYKAWYHKGTLHRSHRPALFYNKSVEGRDITVSKRYYRGQIHSNKGPAVVKFNKEGKILEKKWLSYGHLNRKDGPSRILYSESGSVLKEEWWRNGKQHRVGGPAKVEYYKGGQIKSEEWFSMGELLREGPLFESGSRVLHPNGRFFNTELEKSTRAISSAEQPQIITDSLGRIDFYVDFSGRLPDTVFYNEEGKVLRKCVHVGGIEVSGV